MSIDTPHHLGNGTSEFSHPEIEEIIERHSTRVLGILTLTKDEERVRRALKHMHPDLLIRLRKLKANPFHNMDHFLDVHRRLWILLENLLKKYRPTTSKMLLLGEAALRHDDDHAWNTYRQDVVEWAEMSNEEWAVYLLEQDIKKHGVPVKKGEFLFAGNAMHATSFGQNTLPKNDPRYRAYKANTLEEKLLVFADVSWPLIDWWDYWMKESVRVIEEVWPVPSGFGEWVESKIRFLSYVESLYRELEWKLKKEFRKKVEHNLSDCQRRLEWLLEGNPPEEVTRLEIQLWLANY